VKIGDTDHGSKCPYHVDDAMGKLGFTPKATVSTPYGQAVQATSKEAIAVKNYVNEGGDVYRAGTFGRSNTTDGQFWAPESPLNPGYANKYGVDFTNVDYVISGNVKYSSFVTRPAPGLGNNSGGSIEVVVPTDSVMLKWFHMP
jgi:hypothetical protein